MVELNPEVLTADMTLSIKSILPTEAELSSVQAFGCPNLLDRASKLVFHLNRVPHLVTRLRCHEIPFSWFVFCSSVFAQLRIVQAACDEVGYLTAPCFPYGSISIVSLTVERLPK